MPRFLNTHTGEFVWIAEIGATPYAILSHTWRSAEEGGEQTFDDVVRLQTECTIATHDPWNVETAPPVNEALFSHPKLADKIRRACEVARNAGFRLIWIDSCCIDKRSSAELSEAINSMYALYRDADVCYVYLADVPHGTDPRAEYSRFLQSRWHKRGWTLQELIAPACVVFLSCDWTLLGTKTGLASTLEKITKVDAAILVGITPVESASVAKRMSWAVGRRTTRVEDRAYSLLGIFGVHMSPIYGEGTNAFLRLQEEIIKHIPDQSIFAWGRGCTVLQLNKIEPRGLFSLRDSGILAKFPDAFWDVGDVSPITPSQFAAQIGHPRDLRPAPLHCVFTPQGVRIELMNIPLHPDTAWILTQGFTSGCRSCREAIARSPLRSVALLRCQDRDGHLIALPLLCPDEDVSVAENVAIGLRATCDHWSHGSARVVRLSVAALNEINVAPTCVTVSILRHWQEPVKPKARRDGFSKIRWIDLLALWHYRGTAPKIRLAANCEEELRSVGFTLTPLAVESHRSEDPSAAEFNLTMTLRIDSVAQRLPHDDQHLHAPPLLIELGLRHDRNCRALGHFYVDRLHRPSAVDSADPASPPPDSLSSGPLIHDESCHTPPTAVNPRRINRSFEIRNLSSSRTIAEAEFVIPDVVRADADGASMTYARLLRLKLETPLENACVPDYYHLSFSVELSEPLIGNTAFTGSQADPAVTSTPGFARSERLVGSLLTQAAAESSITQDTSPGPDGRPQPRSDNFTQDSPDPDPSPTTTSKQTAVCEGPGALRPCDAVMHDGPDVTHFVGALDDAPQRYDTTALCEAPLAHDTGSAGRSAFAAHPSEYLPADVTRTDVACPRGVSGDKSTDSSGSLQKALRNVRQFLNPPPQRPRRWISRDNSPQRPP
ncbi:heterokaryon incompatibility protein-domain-containing protein [Lenzites betulinus]|nr:heterokaryon incompatibility protein-domain-containing protein [Lenzites betulinus]